MMHALTRLILTLVALILASPMLPSTPEKQRPNVVLIIADDLGYGDLGINGNLHVKTPVLDGFAHKSIRMNQFYVSPVCAPSRASLMTGRYSLRTGVRDTYNGGAIMASEEVTIAEMLSQAGYRTGIFGKWHLGDNYPFRPNDQGFDESLIHLSGGIGQPGDFTNFFRGDSSYFDPVLWYNGKKQSYDGYCSDIFAEEAIGFIKKNHHDPFFCYLAFNAPHTPLQVPEEYYDMYKGIDPSTGFSSDGKPIPKMSEKDKEDARKVYGMVTNIDDNIGKLLKTLEDLNIADNTIVIFMSDNGPQQRRYVGGMRGRKGSVLLGGVRVPFFFRFPAMFEGNQAIKTPVAHIDILPTLSELCRAEMPARRKVDGQSFLPLLKGNVNDFEERPLFFYWTRRYPELYNNIALQKGSYRLVGNTDYRATALDFELYNFRNDEFERQNIITSNKLLAREMKLELDSLLREMTASPHLKNPPPIIIGSEHENPVYLNRNDAGGQLGIWKQEEIFGFWNVKILEGTYNIRIKFIKPLQTRGAMCLQTGSLIFKHFNENTPTDVIEMKNVHFQDMECALTPYYATREKYILPLWLEFEKTK